MTSLWVWLMCFSARRLGLSPSMQSYNNQNAVLVLMYARTPLDAVEALWTIEAANHMEALFQSHGRETVQ